MAVPQLKKMVVHQTKEMAVHQTKAMPVQKTDVITTLPVEILKQILEPISKHGLKQLSQTCKTLSEEVDAQLWKGMVIDPRDATGLPWPKLAHVQHLHFRIENRKFDTCHSFEFSEMVSVVYNVLSQLKDGQLLTFSWDISAALYYVIFGAGSQLLRQRSIKHFQLSNCINFDLFQHGDQVICGPDLFAGYQLKSLELRAPPVCFHHSRRDGKTSLIRAHASTLEEVHIDLVNYGRWSEWRRTTTQSGYVDDLVFLGLLAFQQGVPHPTLPCLRVLSLTQVPAPRSLAQGLTLDKLTSLTLRNCPGVMDFISELRHTIRSAESLELRKLEFQVIPQSPNPRMDLLEIQRYVWSLTARVFYAIGEFSGLEELYVDMTFTFKQFFESLKRIAWHKNTLKRLVLSDRPLSQYNTIFSLTPPLILEAYDMNANPENNQDDCPRLEFLGLECRPSLMTTLVTIITSTSRLKAVHLRLRSGYNRDNQNMSPHSDMTDDHSSCEEDDRPLCEERNNRADMLSELLPEAKALFRTVPSLVYVAYGNFWRGACVSEQIVMKRVADEDATVSLVLGSPEWHVFMEEFGRSLEVCPEPVIPELPPGHCLHRHA
ncbi:hypothetical protein F5Y18DRAFT_359354 [Xylariaceae sp. FL1019]|nr:hypothetical protein F5Y18DRAFT_359354 [Xylariaceae sp. FL1019]